MDGETTDTSGRIPTEGDEMNGMSTLDILIIVALITLNSVFAASKVRELSEQIEKLDAKIECCEGAAE